MTFLQKTVTSPDQTPPLDFWSLEFQKLPFTQRLDKISSAFLGKPYLLNPLGEQENEQYRFDCFDCITYVETVTALLLSKNFNDFRNRLITIRYAKGEINFLRQNHVHMTADWIPNNIEIGIYKDITTEIANKIHLKTHIAETYSDRPNYFKTCFPQKLIEDKGNTSLIAEQSSCLYISHFDIIKKPDALKSFETGMVINIVRPDWGQKEKYGTNFNISHIGFIIKKENDEIFFRHATSLDPCCVSELPFLDYLKRYGNPEKTSVRGIHILKFSELA